MRVFFSPEARAEFDDGVRYYERQVSGLGRHFRDEVKDAVRRMTHWPMAAPIERGEIRRPLLNRFPYKSLYSVEADHLYVIALAHRHRAPNYWTGRREA